ncbi:hypothetical protein MMC17_003798 [Xylographa soralifera]|nr:hypothetical protein [Xylographa soralifera]
MSHFDRDKVYVCIVTTLLDGDGGQDYDIQAAFEDLEDANDGAKAWLQDSWGFDEDSCEAYEESYSEDGTLFIRAVAGEGEVFEIRVLQNEYRRARKAQGNRIVHQPQEQRSAR